MAARNENVKRRSSSCRPSCTGRHETNDEGFRWPTQPLSANDTVQRPRVLDDNELPPKTRIHELEARVRNARRAWQRAKATLAMASKMEKMGSEKFPSAPLLPLPDMLSEEEAKNGSDAMVLAFKRTLPGIRWIPAAMMAELFHMFSIGIGKPDPKLHCPPAQPPPYNDLLVQRVLRQEPDVLRRASATPSTTVEKAPGTRRLCRNEGVMGQSGKLLSQKDTDPYPF